MAPKISVIIPVYNAEEYINTCLSCILKQTYNDFEVIVIDDGSIDSSLEKCKKIELSDSRVRIIMQENSGVSSARNTGILNAQGEIIAFIDSDDLVAPDYLSVLMEGLTGTDAILSMCRSVRIDDHSYKFSYGQVGFLDMPATICAKRLLSGQFPVSVWGVLFRKQLIGDIRFPVGIQSNEDKIFLYRYLLENEKGKVYYSNEKLYGYLVRDGSATRSSWKGSVDIVKVADQIKNLTENNHFEWIELAYNSCMVARLNIMKYIVLSKKSDDYLHIFREFRKEVLAMGYPKSGDRRLKIEYMTVKFGRLFFTTLVHIYYGIISEKKRFEYNEKITYHF